MTERSESGPKSRLFCHPTEAKVLFVLRIANPVSVGEDLETINSPGNQLDCGAIHLPSGSNRALVHQRPRALQDRRSSDRIGSLRLSEPSQLLTCGDLWKICINPYVTCYKGVAAVPFFLLLQPTPCIIDPIRPPLLWIHNHRSSSPCISIPIFKNARRDCKSWKFHSHLGVKHTMDPL